MEHTQLSPTPRSSHAHENQLFYFPLYWRIRTVFKCRDLTEPGGTAAAMQCSQEQHALSGIILQLDVV